MSCFFITLNKHNNILRDIEHTLFPNIHKTNHMKNTHGGKRKGSGKPKIEGGKPYTYILITADIEAIKGPKAAFVREAVRLHLDRAEGSGDKLGQLIEDYKRRAVTAQDAVDSIKLDPDADSLSIERVGTKANLYREFVNELIRVQSDAQ